MFARGRSGPSRSAPANVRCQKCLKRDKFRPVQISHYLLTSYERHYSYECKSSNQERPYVSRPSRSQQLRNPKLVPKLTSDTLNPLENKKGTADEELAKREAERAAKRELEERDDHLLGSASKRRKSVASDSVSSFSSRASSVSRGRDRTRSPPGTRGRDVSMGSASDHDPRPRGYEESRSRSRSRSPPRRFDRSMSRDSRSPPRLPRERSYRDREDERLARPRRRLSSGSEMSRDSRPRRRDLSRSPNANTRRSGGDRMEPSRRDRERDHGGAKRREPPTESYQRERSLSPFSKRLALTKSMNTSG